jgi:hypothetical protein
MEIDNDILRLQNILIAGEWSGGRISWDWNCNFSWDRNYDHEIKSRLGKVRLGFFLSFLYEIKQIMLD